MKSLPYYLRAIARFFMPNFGSPIEKLPSYDHLNRTPRPVRQHALAINDATRLILVGPSTAELSEKMKHLTKERYMVLGIVPHGTTKLALSFYPIADYDQRRPASDLDTIEHVALSRVNRHASLFWILTLNGKDQKAEFMPCYQLPLTTGSINLLEPSLCVEIDLPYDFEGKYLK